MTVLSGVDEVIDLGEDTKMGSISLTFYTFQNQSVLGTQMVGEVNVTSSSKILTRVLGLSPRTSLTRPVISESDWAFINLKKGLSKWKTWVCG